MSPSLIFDRFHKLMTSTMTIIIIFTKPIKNALRGLTKSSLWMAAYFIIERELLISVSNLKWNKIAQINFTRMVVRYSNSATTSFDDSSSFEFLSMKSLSSRLDVNAWQKAQKRAVRPTSERIRGDGRHAVGISLSDASFLCLRLTAKAKL